MTKKDATPLTLENVLGGKVHQPKVQLSWRRAEKPKSHKCDVHSEAKALQQLAAAVTFLPEELCSQSDQEILANTRCAEERLDCRQWPWFTWQSLLRRVASAPYQDDIERLRAVADQATQARGRGRLSSGQYTHQAGISGRASRVLESIGKRPRMDE